MDVVVQRHRIARLRRLVRSVPGLWRIYWLYWSWRTRREARQIRPTGHAVLDLGQFPSPSLDQPVTQLCTSEQLLGPVYRRWCREIDSPARFSRKQWEFAYILQVLEQHGKLSPGQRGLGFGCGREPLVAVCARRGCDVLATDLAFEQASAQGWVGSAQHASNLDALYESASDFIDRSSFDARVDFRVVDMNHIPEDLHGGFDFVWSACALEHLGSLRHGMDFVLASARCLRPGGVAVHTTEFNVSSDEQTFESAGCSVYRKRDIERLIEELRQQGLEVAPLNLNTGTGRVDHHVDVPPYSFSPNLKLLLEGHVVTSIGLYLKRPA